MRAATKAAVAGRCTAALGTPVCTGSVVARGAATGGAVLKTRCGAISKTVLTAVKTPIMATVSALEAALGRTGAALERRRSGSTRVETVVRTALKAAFRAPLETAWHHFRHFQLESRVEPFAL